MFVDWLISRRCLLLSALLTALGFVNTAPAAKLDAAQIQRAALDFLVPGEFREIRFVHAARDGTVWVLAAEWDWRGGRKGWYARRLGADGVQLGNDVVLLVPGLVQMVPGSVKPIGTLPDGSLIVVIDDGINFLYMGRIRPDGATESIMIPQYCCLPLVDHDGTVHLVAPDRYIRVDATATGMPTVQSLAFGQSPGNPVLTQDNFRWERDCRDRQAVLYDDGPGQILVAVRMPDQNTRLYRVSTKTLAIVDSGSVNSSRDVYRTWAEPAPARIILTPARESGYWLFLPTVNAQSTPVVVAYRLRPDLSPVRPTAVAATAVMPFSTTPPEAVTSVVCQYVPPKRYSGVDVQVKLKLEFMAYSSDGQLYAQTFEDSVRTHKSE
jgi:hypothetical protein